MPAVTFKREVSLGTVVHLVLLAGAALLFFDRMATQQKELLEGLREERVRVERVEKYLSSKDSHYWELIQKMSFEEEHGGTQLDRSAAALN